MSDALTTKIAPLEELGSYGKYEAGPFAPGYGVTLGNALRRVLLGSLEGAAVTAVQIDGVMQEFSSLPGVREDVVQILLNVKKIRLRSFAKERIELTLSKKGAGPVTAGDIKPNGQVEIVNPELVLATLDSDKAAIEAKNTALMEASQKLGEKMYADMQASQGQQAAAAAQGQPEAGAAKAADDNVVDAEVKEVKKG